jgi:CHAT domain-containing protein
VSFYFENDNKKVNLFLEKLLLKNKLDLEKYVEFLSESEFSKIKPLIERGRTFSYNILQSSPNQFPEINIGCFENQLLLKNLSLRNQERIKTTIEKSSDAIVKEKHQQFIENKRYLTKLDEIPISERPKNYEAIKADTENLEKELTRLSSTFADAKKSLTVNWKQVQEKLKPNEIAIDLVDYTYYNKKWTDSIYYGAFIIKTDSKFPKYITLFEKKQLAILLSENKNQQDSTKINKHYLDKAISDLFLKPLQNELKGVSSIYLSPSGLGHQINFSALPVSETQTLGDKYEVHILGSTAEMVTYNEANLGQKTNTELVLYGNIDYSKSDATNKAASDTLATKNTAFTELYTRSANTEEYHYLGGSKIEINKINALAQQNNFASTIVEDRKATEESIKAFDCRTTPFVLHLATHGFFFPDVAKEIPNQTISPETYKKSYYKIAEDPMMRSGLILAGANKNLKKSSEGDTIEDGILTASEISNLDLSACQLVILSACETGLGQINGSEGVFGLQRAFKMAGVKNIIMSLWKVPDAPTAELFDIFYTECFAGKTIHEAFQTSQAKMKVKYSPYYWAGFVLLE